MTERLFLQDARLATASARVVASGPEGIVLDRTVFYARSGGQPGDTGRLRWHAQETPIADTVKGDGDAILHLPDAAAALPEPGTELEAVVNWPRRARLMRMHTALHLLCSVIRGAAVTGGQIGTDRSRLDFDLPDPPPRDELEAKLNATTRCWTPIPR
jgi:misacylated tRNA(Ala) deacylase